MATRFPAAATLANANEYRFSSKLIHANSGLYYYGYRWYDPNLQRWLNRDPGGERYDANLHRFVYNSPNGRIQPYPMREADAVLGVGRFDWLWDGTNIVRHGANSEPPILFVPIRR